MKLLQLTAANAFVFPAAKAADLLFGSRGCLFTFHRAAPAEMWPSLPNRDFHLDLDFLDRFLAYLLAAGWQVVTIGEALRRSSGDNACRYVNFSIDDCYRDTYELVAPLFRRYDVPLTLFVTTGIPDGTLPLWWAGLEDALIRHDRLRVGCDAIQPRTDDERRAAYQSIASSWDGPEAVTHYAAFCAANGIDIEAMHWRHAISWQMLEELARDPLVEIGAHTVSHARISSLEPAAALAELEQSRLRLNERLGIQVEHFAFPYGRAGDCGPRDMALAREAGFRSAASTRKGLVLCGQDAFDLPRNTINGSHRSVAAMQMHLTGLSGQAARVLRRV